MDGNGKQDIPTLISHVKDLFESIWRHTKGKCVTSGTNTQYVPICIAVAVYIVICYNNFFTNKLILVGQMCYKQKILGHDLHFMAMGTMLKHTRGVNSGRGIFCLDLYDMRSKMSFSYSV